MTNDWLSSLRNLLVANLTKSMRGFPSKPWDGQHKCCFSVLPRSWLISTTEEEENNNINDPLTPIHQIGKEKMTEIIQDYEKKNSHSKYVVIDVRDQEEVAASGKLSPQVITLPVPIILDQNVFAMNEKDFQNACGFQKPKHDQMIVFSCAVGIRSNWAAYAAALAGYESANYMGGSEEWFQS